MYGGIIDEMTGLEDTHDTSELPEDYVPSESDVIVGWARQNYHHGGNRKLRDVVQKHVPQYVVAKSKTEKGVLISSIIRKLRKESPTGSGLVRQNPKTLRWSYIGLDKAKDKIGHALRKASQEYQKKHRLGKYAAKAKRLLHHSASYNSLAIESTGTARTSTSSDDEEEYQAHRQHQLKHQPQRAMPPYGMPYDGSQTSGGPHGPPPHPAGGYYPPNAYHHPPVLQYPYPPPPPQHNMSYPHPVPSHSPYPAYSSAPPPQPDSVNVHYHYYGGYPPPEHYYPPPQMPYSEATASPVGLPLPPDAVHSAGYEDLQQHHEDDVEYEAASLEPLAF